MEIEAIAQIDSKVLYEAVLALRIRLFHNALISKQIRKGCVCIFNMDWYMKNKAKFRISLLAWLLLTVFAMQSCDNEADLILGKWERYDDRSAGTTIRVEKVGDAYQGKLVDVKGLAAEMGFTENEVKWKALLPVDRKYYEGKDLLKAVNRSGDVSYVRYDAVYFKLVSNDIMHVSGFARAEESIGSEQKWRRVKE